MNNGKLKFMHKGCWFLYTSVTRIVIGRKHTYYSKERDFIRNIFL